ncbi:hypothetical protein LCGC14_1236610, partial [marine sediment metagenome]
FIVFNLVIVFSFAFIFFMPLLLLGQEYFSLTFKHNLIPALLFVFTFIIINSYFLSNWKLFNLLEAENWPQLIEFLEEEIFIKNRVRGAYIKMLINAYLFSSTIEKIASLEARFDAQKQAYARKPRVMRVTAASTLKSTNAWYVQNWVSKVTRVGNINYPTEARRAGVYGTLRMLVSMQKDGTIKEVVILHSSGSTLLDDAAIRIVRLAAPFAPFPDDMRKEVDELEIIRTWSFQQRGLTSG